MRTHLALLAALATRKVTVGAMRKGMNLVRRFSKSSTFLQAHDESAARLAAFATATGTPATANAPGVSAAGRPSDGSGLAPLRRGSAGGA